MNKVILIGNVGGSPDVKDVNGTKMATFSLATNDGTREKPVTSWHGITYWGKGADFVEKYIRKGMKIMVEGTIRYHKIEEKTFTNIWAERIEMLSKNEKDDLPF